MCGMCRALLGMLGYTARAPGDKMGMWLQYAGDVEDNVGARVTRYARGKVCYMRGYVGVCQCMLVT